MITSPPFTMPHANSLSDIQPPVKKRKTTEAPAEEALNGDAVEVEDDEDEDEDADAEPADDDEVTAAQSNPTKAAVKNVASTDKGASAPETVAAGDDDEE